MDNTEEVGGSIDSGTEVAAIKEEPPIEELKTIEPEDDEDEHHDTKKGALDLPLIVQGKRERTKVEHFASTLSPKVEMPRAEVNAGKGAGMTLGDIAAANEYISKKSATELKQLHKLLYLREGKPSHPSIFKRALRNFNGWWFGEDSDEWSKRVAFLRKLKTVDVKHLRAGVGLHQAAQTREAEIENVMHYLLKPTGKSTQEETNKKEKNKAQKRKSTTKAKMPAKKKRTSKAALSDDERSENSDDNEEEEVPKKSTKKKSRKSAAEPVKPSENEPAKKDSETDDDSVESDDQEKGEGDSKQPSDKFIKSTIRDLLKTFDLSQVSMKQMVQAVCDKFPESDLEERKGFLKEIIKELLSES